VFIHGQVQVDKRQPLVDRFQTDPKCRLIVGNMIAMGEGLTLTASSNVAFIEFGWNPKTHDQAEDRCHRIGQHDSVMVWNLVAENTIDEEIVALIEEKRQIVNAIQDGVGADSQRQMMEDLAARMEARRLMAKERGKQRTLSA
jgi:SWI/SNF-related matrix-associated actin-dependent regulator 1 of chromatin subfamily A